MTHVHTLTRHRDIQNWVADRHGLPALIRDANLLGQTRAKLALRFDAPGRPRGMPRVDQGATPVSWTAWLAELDRQHLALRVSAGGETEYELIERKSLN